MSALKNLVRTALHECGGLAAVRRSNRAGFRILTYHAFSAERMRSLDWQCRHLRRFYQPVTMSAVAESLHGGKPLPDYALAVTVDDGNADFARAHPIFEKHGIPVLVYLVSDFLDHRLWFWWNQIQYACSHTSHAAVEIALAPTASLQRFPLTPDTWRQTADFLIATAKNMPNSHRLALCHELLERLDVTLPAELPAEWRPLDWDQVRQLERGGVEFGAHTKTHPILSTVEDSASLHEEICGSKARIEQELNAPAIHFCYPNGRLRDLDERTDELVRECGFRTAVTMQAGVNFRADPFLLRRFGVDPALPAFYFAEVVAGVHPLRQAREALRLPDS
jgi:peptidoglycan/xylan/chitin deacetylase (PgdA/CDA1 family)